MADTIPEDLMKKIELLPTTTGIYRFLDQNGRILYIGKAINLRSRVKSYFASGTLDRPWVEQMIPLIADVSTIKTENEVEALILESNLIKKYTPKYNSAGKDDKRYAWILVNTRAPFPKIEKTRDLGRKGRYFGPYPDGRAVNQVLKYLRKLYPYRDCNLEMFPDRAPESVTKSRLCMYYHLDLCTGPCDNLISSKKYKKDIRNITKLLSGKRKSPIRQLEKRMRSYAERKKFEKAAELRDKIQDLRYLSQRIDLDFGDAEDEFKKIQQTRYIAGISEVVRKLAMNIPEHKIKNTRIECYDISNISGEITYGSMVVTIGSTIKPSEYRIFKIREQKKSNDPEMMRRVLERRLRYLNEAPPDGMKDSESLLKHPQIIVVDGAQPQLSAVNEIIPDNIGLIGISKGKHLKRAGQKKVDEFWRIDNEGNFRKFSLENPFIFQQLRDEAHRFAIKHHRKGRRFEQKKSVLDDIPGIGPKRKKILMKKFKTVEKIKGASEKELNEVLKNKNAAQQVHEYFRSR